MSSEFEEQQRIAHELREQLRSLEEEEKSLTAKVKVLEAKLVVQDLLGKVKAKRESISHLRTKIQELEGRLKSPKEPSIKEQLRPQQEKAPRAHF